MNWKEITDLGENGIYCWYLDEKISTQFPYDKIDVNLISIDAVRKDDISQFDFQTIETIVDKIDLYFAQAIEHIKDSIRRSPKQFRFTEEEMDNIRKMAEENQYFHIPDNNIEQYLSVSIYEFPVSMPNVIFYPDKTFMVRFVESGLPTVNYGHGIGIFFNEKGEIVDLEIFSEG